MLRFFISAGEYSGDLHAASLVRELKIIFPDAEFCGIGGEHLEKEGVELIYHIKDLSILGFQEAIRGIFRIRKLLRESVRAARDCDVCIFVDYPGFNLKLASHTKKLGKLNFYYIAPQVWAWWSFRTKIIRKLFNYVFVIMPFEKAFFRKYGVKVEYVGNPVLDRVLQARVEEIEVPEGKKVIGLLPGSRHDEVRRLLPRFLRIKNILETERNDLYFLLSLVPDYEMKEEKNLKILKGASYEIMKTSDVLLVASGTASLETALFEKPMVVIYALSELSWIIAKMVARVKYASLVNILAGDMIVPEFVQHIPEEKIAGIILNYMDNPEIYKKTVLELKKLRKILKPGAARNAALIIKEEVIKHGYA